MMRCPRNSIKYFGYDLNLFCFDKCIQILLLVCFCHITVVQSYWWAVEVHKGLVAKLKLISKGSIWHFVFLKKKYSWQRKSVGGFWNSNWLQRGEDEALPLTNTARLLLSQRSEGDREDSIRGLIEPQFFWKIIQDLITPQFFLDKIDSFRSLTRPLKTHACKAVASKKYRNYWYLWLATVVNTKR